MLPAARAGSAAASTASAARPAMPARAERAARKPWRIAASLEVHVAEHEVPGPPWSVVSMEAISVVEPDVAQQRDLHAESQPRAHLEVERLDLAAQVPDVSGIEEKHTVKRVGN